MKVSTQWYVRSTARRTVPPCERILSGPVLGPGSGRRHPTCWISRTVRRRSAFFKLKCRRIYINVLMHGSRQIHCTARKVGVMQHTSYSNFSLDEVCKIIMTDMKINIRSGMRYITWLSEWNFEFTFQTIFVRIC